MRSTPARSTRSRRAFSRGPKGRSVTGSRLIRSARRPSHRGPPMRSMILLGAAAIALAACTPTDEAKSGVDGVEMSRLAQGSTYQPGCGGRRDDDRLIRNETDWASYWQQVHPDSSGAPPAVD